MIISLTLVYFGGAAGGINGIIVGHRPTRRHLRQEFIVGRNLVITTIGVGQVLLSTHRFASSVAITSASESKINFKIKIFQLFFKLI